MSRVFPPSSPPLASKLTAISSLFFVGTETSIGSRKTSLRSLRLKVRRRSSSLPPRTRLTSSIILSTADNHYVRSLTNPKANSSFPTKKHTQAYDNVLDYFASNKVKLVVRLNNPLYDQRDFEARGIQFKDMFFEDGTNVSFAC